MVHAGFRRQGLGDLGRRSPVAIPAAVESLFLEAEPERALAAVEQLDWAKAPKYFMFERRIKSWSSSKLVKADLKKFVVGTAEVNLPLSGERMTASAERLASLERDIRAAAKARDAGAVAAGWRASSTYFFEVSATRVDPEPPDEDEDYTAALGPGQGAPWRTSAGNPSRRCRRSPTTTPTATARCSASATRGARRPRSAAARARAPKCAVLTERTPLTIGIAHDAERLGAVGEVAVGPDEFATIRLACRGRVLTTTNVGSRSTSACSSIRRGSR